MNHLNDYDILKLYKIASCIYQMCTNDKKRKLVFIMNTKIVIDITQTIGSSLRFKEAKPKTEFGSEKVIGTSVFVLDKDGNEQVVSIYKPLSELPILSKLSPFDEVVFERLEGYVRGTSREGSKFVTLKLILKAENVRGKTNG